eukprot:TRINITY_DN2877_c0_g1_i4.p1 TRINITY_DN2877_c0_g1~~TRINITY_DN2877_c0_g1_i4.p1  ORF type:complete len:116 (+),score=26.01 TRINITY_DN2877_c0_g1_i4:82-429(+)
MQTVADLLAHHRDVLRQPSAIPISNSPTTDTTDTAVTLASDTSVTVSTPALSRTAALAELSERSMSSYMLLNIGISELMAGRGLEAAHVPELTVSDQRLVQLCHLESMVNAAMRP